RLDLRGDQGRRQPRGILVAPPILGDLGSDLSQQDLRRERRVGDQDHRRRSPMTAVVSSPPASIGSNDSRRADGITTAPSSANRCNPDSSDAGTTLTYGLPS